MSGRLIKKVIGIGLAILLLFQTTNIIKTVKVLATTTPSISVSQNQNSYTITANLSDYVPAGNIIDLEIYNQQNQKIWQDFTDKGGNSFSATTPNLNPGNYRIAVGLFTSNWASNYGWYDNVYTLNVSPSVQVPNGQPIVTSNINSDSTYTITSTFSSPVPSGNIIDIEIFNQQNQRIWQSFTTNGGSIYSAKTNYLAQGSYRIAVGLFTPNWASNYAWYNNAFTLNIGSSVQVPTTASPTPSASPTPTPSSSQNVSQNQNAISAANNAYNQWKGTYVQNVSSGVDRVIRPENGNDTVSEGIGYGMLLSYFASDQPTFDGLWNYGKQHLDSKGLMSWQISSSGSVIGQGSATDADEDMAYALLRAEGKWPGHGYGQGAKNLISAMMTTEVLSSNLINPGDNWGNTQIMNPSYLSPAFYRAFAGLTGDNRWNTVADTNLSWEQKASDPNTGLVPDWLNADLSQPSISWDQYPNGFYYDASRAPIRLLMDYKWNNNQTAAAILSKENNFLSGIGVSKLVSGYSLSGSPLTSYLNDVFLSAYASAAQVNSSSQFSNDSLNALIQKSPDSYFSASLRTIALFVIGGAY